jgi:FkbH-like protein
VLQYRSRGTLCFSDGLLQDFEVLMNSALVRSGFAFKMFEFEQSERAILDGLSHPALDPATQKEYGPERLRSFSVMNWGEHCTECVYPTCYQTCSFYAPRPDGRCRRFRFGIERVSSPTSWMGYSAYIEFKNWSKLWAQGNATQLPGSVSRALGFLERVAWGVASPVDWFLRKVTGKKRLSLVVQSLRRRLIRRIASLYSKFPKPDCLLIEVFNPMTEEARLHLGIRGMKGCGQGRFEWTARAAPGFSSFPIPVADLERALDLSQPFGLDLSVANEDKKRLYFCSATFVRLAKVPKPTKSAGPKKIKCVVWDLDNTLWDGVLIEGTAGAVPTLKEGIRSTLEELDRRGILLSVASKNSEEDARKALEALGVWDFFLAPQINWQPKSGSLHQVAHKLNLGIDSFAFVDDQPFERDEVAVALPMVTLIPAEEISSMLKRPEFSGDESQDGASRRLMYQTEMKRQEAMVNSVLGYDTFLATCGIRAKIERPGDDLVPRIQDIVQRTNQLNIASQRYNLEETRALIHSPDCHCYIVSCSDNYGDYGYVGFITLAFQNDGILIRDCMFSCRIQGKRIDEAVLAQIINQYISGGAKVVRARFISTKKNAPAGEMLARLGFAAQPGMEGVLAITPVALRQTVPYVQLTFSAPPIATPVPA